MAYQKMAYLYDQLMSHAPYDDWVQFTEEIFADLGFAGKRIADLGCGTGEISTRLAQKGYNVIGVDNSQDMLTYAEHKASTQNLPIQWLLQDLREMDGLYDLDAAFSYCDVLNYITDPEELQNTFHHIYHSLKSGGLFLFDVHSLQYIRENYLDQTFAEVTDDASYIWFCTPGDEAGEMYHDLTFFYLENGKYERFDEQHHQRTYPINFYKDFLKNAGFEDIKIYADFSSIPNNMNENAARIFFSASKRSR
ncbi:class I SAM-dependent methyltransferase [Ralstonia pickettii]|nr:class I SAM-dependent methyltransferase [Ralstonia pickettii]